MNSALRHVIGDLAHDGAESATPPPMFENAGLPIVLSEAGGDDRLRPTLISPTADISRAGELLRMLGFVGPPGGPRFERDDLIVELDRGDGGGPSPPPNRVGRLHVAIEVRAIEEACGHLEAAGFGFKSRPIRSAAPIWWTFLREPLGAGVELVDLTS